MTKSRFWQPYAALFSTAIICTLVPDIAAAAGFTDFLNNVLKEFEAVRQPLALIGLILTGILYLFNVIDLRRTAYVVVGIIIMYAASEILNLITGGS